MNNFRKDPVDEIKSFWHLDMISYKVMHWSLISPNPF